MTPRLCSIFILFLSSFKGSNGSWQIWWTYDGISGPDFWGRLNPEWSLCHKGKHQSPIDINPEKLLYDPQLTEIHIDKHRVSGLLENTGQSLVFRIPQDQKPSLNISGGPLTYRYRFQELHIHYGNENDMGSEHRINGLPFPAEIQLYGFNSDLYHNMSEARHKSQGIVGVAILVQVGDKSNEELRILTSSFNKVIFRGQKAKVHHLNIRQLLPDTEKYMTYEGSTTYPGCWETTTWVIFNKPIYMTRQEMYALRKVMQGDEELPKAPLGNNVRPLQPLHHRTVRTNIDFLWSSPSINCPTMTPKTSYKANTPWASP